MLEVITLKQVCIRFKGIVKEDLRGIFEPIALEGKWQESQDPVLRSCGYPYRDVDVIPAAGHSGTPQKWKKDAKQWRTSYDKKTGQWIFETDVNNEYYPYTDWINIIVPSRWCDG